MLYNEYSDDAPLLLTYFGNVTEFTTSDSRITSYNRKKLLLNELKGLMFGIL